MKFFYQKKMLGAGLVLLFLVSVWASQSLAAYPYPSPYSSGFDPYAGQGLGARLFQHLLAAIFGGILGAFFSEKFKQYRRWIFIGMMVLGAIAGTITSVYFGNIAFFLLGFAVAYIFLKNAIAARKRAKSTTFGSAEWANFQHLQENNLIGKEGFTLGVFKENGIDHPLHYKGDRHLLTVAPTRSGKGVSSIIPNLLNYRGSAIVVDPKGENAMVTAARRGRGDKNLNIRGLGQIVHVIDPWGITGLPSSRFNPLDWLDPEDVDINENAMILADSIITPQAGNRDQFWDDEAKSLLTGFLLWVALEESEKGNRTLARVRDIISLGTKDLNDILGEMASSSNHIVSSAGVRTLSKDEKLKSSLLASLQAHTHFLDSPRMRESLSVSDFNFADLKTSHMTIYLVLPADRLETFGRWLRLLIQQALTVNARNIKTIPKRPVLFLLDEMAALGRLTMVEQAFSLMAGFGVQLWGIIQDLSQLERIYAAGWQTFIGNSGVLQYFGSRDLKTAEYFSKLCGVTTIEKFSFATSIARSLGFSSSTGSSSNSSNTTFTENATEDVVQRNLAFPDELMVLRDNKQLVFIESFNPIRAQKIAWFADDQLKTFGKDIRQHNTVAPEPQKAILPKEQAETPPPKEVFKTAEVVVKKQESSKKEDPSNIEIM